MPPAVVEFAITADGSTRDVVLRESSRSGGFDDIAQQVVAQPQLLRPLPPGIDAVVVRASFGPLDPPPKSRR